MRAGVRHETRRCCVLVFSWGWWCGLLALGAFGPARAEHQTTVAHLPLCLKASYRLWRPPGLARRPASDAALESESLVDGGRTRGRGRPASLHDCKSLTTSAEGSTLSSEIQPGSAVQRVFCKLCSATFSVFSEVCTPWRVDEATPVVASDMSCPLYYMRM